MIGLTQRRVSVVALGSSSTIGMRRNQAGVIPQDALALGCGVGSRSGTALGIVVETLGGGPAWWEWRCVSARAAAGPVNDAPASAIVAAAAGSKREKRRFGRTCFW